jgi:hypothetical protein
VTRLTLPGLGVLEALGCYSIAPESRCPYPECEQVLVPAGPFMMGADEPEGSTRPAYPTFEVYLVEPGLGLLPRLGSGIGDRHVPEDVDEAPASAALGLLQIASDVRQSIVADLLRAELEAEFGMDVRVVRPLVEPVLH